jgi:hypothetical protein
MIFWIAYLIVVLLGYWVINWVYPGFDPVSWYSGAFTALVGFTILDMKNYIHFEIEYVDEGDNDDEV